MNQEIVNSFVVQEIILGTFSNTRDGSSKTPLSVLTASCIVFIAALLGKFLENFHQLLVRAAAAVALRVVQTAAQMPLLIRLLIER